MGDTEQQQQQQQQASQPSDSSSSGSRRAQLVKTKSSRLSKQAEVLEDTTCDALGTPQAKMCIPETRVESFEEGGAVVTHTSIDQLDAENCESGSPLAKSKMLVRSHALCGDDDTKLNPRGIEKQSSSKTASSACSSLSRDSSTNSYTDATGINLEDFIQITLHKNHKDRQMLLQLEDELRRFVIDTGKQVHKFPPMSSYNRMLVHRIAAFFGLDHNVDQSGQAVVVTKNKDTRMPDVEFKQYIKSDIYSDDTKRLLRRDVQSYEEVVRGGGAAFTSASSLESAQQAQAQQQRNSNMLHHNHHLLEQRQTRSFEERAEHYPPLYDGQHYNNRTFFNQESSSSQEIMESPLSNAANNGYSSDSMHLAGALYVQTAAAVGGNNSGLAAPDAHVQGVMLARPWSSTDSHSSSLDVPLPHPAVLSQHTQQHAASSAQQQQQATVPLSMQKAGSFGGVPSVYRQAAVVDAASVSPVRPSQPSGGHRTPGDCMSPHNMVRQPSIPETQPFSMPPSTGAPFCPPSSHVICALPANEVPLNAIILHPRPVPRWLTSCVPEGGMAYAGYGQQPPNSLPASSGLPYATGMQQQQQQQYAQQQPATSNTQENLAAGVQSMSLQQQPPTQPQPQQSTAQQQQAPPLPPQQPDAQQIQQQQLQQQFSSHQQMYYVLPPQPGADPSAAPQFVPVPYGYAPVHYAYTHAHDPNVPVTQVTYMTSNQPVVYGSAPLHTSTSESHSHVASAQGSSDNLTN